jgi:hypothetical protein
MILAFALLLHAGRCRSVAATATIALMLAIMPMGHFAWFNLLTVAVALVALAADGRRARRPDCLGAGWLTVCTPERPVCLGTAEARRRWRRTNHAVHHQH